MLYDAENPEQYIQELEEDWRKEKLLVLKDLILGLDPSLELGIHYKMLVFRRGEKEIFHLNAQKAYVSLYGYFSKYTYDTSLLEDFSTGKGCIRIKKSIKLEETRLKEFLKIQLGM